MKPKYTARVYFDDDRVIEHMGDDLKLLIDWMHSQAKERLSEINGEIIDNTTHTIIQSIQYDPLEE